MKFQYWIRKSIFIELRQWLANLSAYKLMQKNNKPSNINININIINKTIIDQNHWNKKQQMRRKQSGSEYSSQMPGQRYGQRINEQPESASQEERNFYKIDGELKKHPKSQQQHKPKPKQVPASTLINCLYAFIKKVKVLPTILLHQLQKRQKKFDPQDPLIYYPFHPKDLNFSVRTREGKDGVGNLIRYLEDVESKQSEGLAKEVTVEWSHELHLAANKRINAMEKGNASVQGQDVGELVSEFGSWKGPLCEIVVYGFIDPKQILIEAFLEDDSRAKNNRAQFFNEGSKFVGIDMGHHETYQVVTVIIFAGGINKLNKNNAAFSPSISTTYSQCQCKIW